MTEKRIVSETLNVLIGPISPELVLGAGIPLKPKASIKGAYAEALARHVKIYLQHNPDEAARYIELVKGDDPPEDLLAYEMMLERSQFIRAIILRAVLRVKRMGNWEFCSAIDEDRLSDLVYEHQISPHSHILEGGNCTLLQGKDPEPADYLED